MLESPDAETKDDESELAALLCGDVLDGDQDRAQVGISSVKVEMFSTFEARPVVNTGQWTVNTTRTSVTCNYWRML